MASKGGLGGYWCGAEQALLAEEGKQPAMESMQQDETPEKWDEGETRASSREAIGLEEDVMGMAQGRERMRAGSEATHGGQRSVLGSLMGVLFQCRWLLPSAVPQGGNLET